MLRASDPFLPIRTLIPSPIRALVVAGGGFGTSRGDVLVVLEALFLEMLFLRCLRQQVYVRDTMNVLFRAQAFMPG